MKLDEAIEDPKKLKNLLADNNLNPKEKIEKRLTNLILNSVKLGYSLTTGKNITDLNDKTMKVMSPRFLSVLPDDEENVIFLFYFTEKNGRIKKLFFS